MANRKGANISSSLSNNVYSLFILNHSNGKIFQKDFVAHPQLTGNDAIYYSGVFCGLSKMGVKLSPNSRVNDGIESIVSDGIRIECFHALSGMKIFVLADPHTQNLQQFLSEIYNLFTDYVLKNPFHTIDMPIKSTLFAEKVDFVRENF